MVEQSSSQLVERWQTEVLRRASVCLDGRMVGVWEVAPDHSLQPLTSGVAPVVAEAATPGVEVALHRLQMPAPPGSRWVAGRLGDNNGWCVAPVRSRVPDPPPLAQERRCRQRLALELAGLCLGLREQAGSESASGGHELFQRFMEQLGGLARQISSPLATAQASIARIDATLQKEQRDTALSDALTQDVWAAKRALQAAADLLADVEQRARAVLESAGDFDVAEAVWSAVMAERGWAAEREVTLTLRTLTYALAVTGESAECRRAVTLLVKGAVGVLRGRAGAVVVALEDHGPMARLTVRVAGGTESPGDEGAAPSDLERSWRLAEPREIVERRLGGSLRTTPLAGGASVVVILPVAPRPKSVN